MKILVVSDLHMEKRSVLPDVAGGADFDVMVCAGDVRDDDIRRSCEYLLEVTSGHPCVFVAGIHEYWGRSVDGVIENGRTLSRENSNFYFIENDSVTIGDTTFAGATLWETAPVPVPHPLTSYGQSIDIRGPDFDRPAKWRDIRRLHDASVAFLSGCPADVVVTHFPPSPTVFRRITASLWIYGHEHGSADLTFSDRRLVRNALGYPGQETLGFEYGCVIEVAPLGLRHES